MDEFASTAGSTHSSKAHRPAVGVTGRPRRTFAFFISSPTTEIFPPPQPAQASRITPTATSPLLMRLSSTSIRATGPIRLGYFKFHNQIIGDTNGQPLSINPFPFTEIYFNDTSLYTGPKRSGAAADVSEQQADQIRCQPSLGSAHHSFLASHPGWAFALE
jgi:hypothetical protein